MTESISDLDVVTVGERSGLTYAHLHPRLAAAVAALELASFPTALPEDLYDTDEVLALATEFPEGCFVGLGSTGDVVAIGLGVRAAFDLDHPQHTVHDIFKAHGKSGHDPSGEWYYGTSIAVRADHRRMGIGHELYELRKGVCRELNLLGIVAGGVIPGYAEHKDHMTADEYVAAVQAGELYDRTLTFQIENGFEARGSLAGYIRDPAVDDYAALIVWFNPDRSAT